MRRRLVRNRRGAAHVLVRRVGARSDQRDLELRRPVVLLHSRGELRDRGSKIGGERTVDVRLEFGEVDLDDLVVLGTLVGLEVMLEGLGVGRDVAALGRAEVVAHARVVGEEGGGRADFGTHVADGGHTRARERLHTSTGVLDDGAGTTLNSEDTRDLEDDIWGEVSRR